MQPRSTPTCRGRRRVDIEQHPDQLGAHGWRTQELIEQHSFLTTLQQSRTPARLKQLETKEGRLIDLASDGDMPRERIRAKLLELKMERARIETGLAVTGERLAVGASVIREALALRIRRRCSAPAQILSPDS